ncbi:MAG: glycosyltransferase [Melioribacteraceae bacterium]
MPLFSIVTINYNNINGFIRTKTCLEVQICQNFEWIIVDGGSSDGFLELNLSSTTMNHILISQKDNGIYDAMNKGIKLASGEFVLFLNSGDLLYDCYTLKKIEDYLNKSIKSPDIIFGSSLYKLKNGYSLIRKTYLLEEYLWHGLPANQQSTYYHKRLFTNQNYDLKYEICGDYFILSSLHSKSYLDCIYFSQSLSIFEANGKSFGFKKKLFLEPYQIQKKILKTSFLKRILSLLKRFYSTSIIIIVSSEFFKIMYVRLKAWKLIIC